MQKKIPWIRVRGRIDDISPSNISAIFLGMFAIITAIMLIAFGMAAMQPAKAEETLSKPCLIEKLGPRVLYFNCWGKRFGTALADYINHYDDYTFGLSIEAVVNDTTYGGGTIVIIRLIVR